MIVELIARGERLVSAHALERLVEHELAFGDVAEAFALSQIVEDYPDYYAGPAVLVLVIIFPKGVPIHALWGIKKDSLGPAVLLTVYPPDPDRWMPDFRRRKP